MKKAVRILMAVLMVMALSVSAMAVEFTPSVEQKGAPEVSTVVHEGEEYTAIIHHEDDKEDVKAGVPATHLVITPISKVNDAPEEIKESLEAANEQINNLESLSELVPDILDVLDNHHEDVAQEDLVIRDLFDVTVADEYKDELSHDEHVITIRFDLGLGQDVLLVVLHNHTGSEWEIIPENRVVINEDGSVDVTFDSLSPIAFVVDAAAVEVDPAGPQSPQTGVNDVAYAGVCAIVVCAAIAAFVALRKKNAAV